MFTFYCPFFQYCQFNDRGQAFMMWTLQKNLMLWKESVSNGSSKSKATIETYLFSSQTPRTFPRHFGLDPLYPGMSRDEKWYYAIVWNLCSLQKITFLQVWNFYLCSAHVRYLTSYLTLCIRFKSSTKLCTCFLLVQTISSNGSIHSMFCKLASLLSLLSFCTHKLIDDLVLFSYSRYTV